MYLNVSVLETRGIVAFHHWRSQRYTSLADCVDSGVSDGSLGGDDRDGSLSLLVTDARWGGGVCRLRPMPLRKFRVVVYGGRDASVELAFVVVSVAPTCCV